MKILMILIGALILLFSFGVSGYISFFKVPLTNQIGKLFTFVMIGAVATVVTTIFCLSIMWPPVMM